MQVQRGALAFVVVNHDQNNCLAHVASALTHEGTGDVPQARARGLPHWPALMVLQAYRGIISRAEGQVQTLWHPAQPLEGGQPVQTPPRLALPASSEVQALVSMLFNWD